MKDQGLWSRLLGNNKTSSTTAATKISVPCSSANVGPGFDVIGLALSIYLELFVRIDAFHSSSGAPFDCVISCSGDSSAKISNEPDVNLVTRVALYVLRCHGQRSFPRTTFVHIVNNIPMGRGLGSSGAAVVGGVLLGNHVGDLHLSNARILDYCLMIERHPDNVAAALQGGFVGTYLKELRSEDMARKEIPLSEVLPEPAGGIDTGENPPLPPIGIGHYHRFTWSPAIKAIAVIPDFKVDTAKAREVLPGRYSTKDVVFNLQRLPLLISALGCATPQAEDIYEAMQDRIHQPFREDLIPGLGEITRTVNPNSHPGLLGVCLSGAGPTILALATENFEEIATAIMAIFRKHQPGVQCSWEVLNPAYEGATITGPSTWPNWTSLSRFLDRAIRNRLT